MGDHKKLTSLHRHSLGDRKYQSNNVPLFKTPEIPLRKVKKIINKLEINHHNYNQNCTKIKEIKSIVVVTNRKSSHTKSTSSKSVNKRKVYKRTEIQSSTSTHLIVTPASKMIWSFSSRSRGLDEEFRDPKRRKLDAGNFHIEPIVSDSLCLKKIFGTEPERKRKVVYKIYPKREMKRCSVSIKDADHNENSISSADHLSRCMNEDMEQSSVDFESKIEPVTSEINSSENDEKLPKLKVEIPSPVDVKFDTENLTKVEHKCLTDAIDTENVKPSTVKAEIDEIKPTTTYPGQLLWARSPGYPPWPAIVCDFGTDEIDIKLQYFGDKGSYDLSKIKIVSEFQGIDSLIQLKIQMKPLLSKKQWKAWFSQTIPVKLARAIVGATYVLSKDVDIRLALYDVILICSYQDMKNPPSLPKMISKYACPSQLEAVNTMFKENPKIFEEVKQKLTEISSEFGFHSKERQTTTSARKSIGTQTPVPNSKKLPNRSTRTPRRHSAPPRMLERRRSTRLETISHTRIQSPKEANIKEEIQQHEIPQRKYNYLSAEKKLIEFEKDLNVYMITARQKESLFKGLRRGYACKKCLSLDDQDLVKCSGDCGDHVHRKCAYTPNGSNEVRCHDCSDVKSHVCYACKQKCLESEAHKIVRCDFKTCQRYYHEQCLGNWLQTKSLEPGTVICPLHGCHHCLSPDPRNTHHSCRDSDLTRCIKCLSTYHIDSNCIPAGVIILTTHQHICVRHRTETRAPVHMQRCYICGLANGTFNYCKSCPLSTHKKCVRPVTAEPYYCDCCETGRHPMNSEIVWVKYAQSRFWPAVVVPPDCIPNNIEEVAHKGHDLCVRFFGTYEFGWVGRSVVYIHDDADLHEHVQKESDGKRFNRAVEEAEKWYPILKIKMKQSVKVAPIPFKRICKLYPVPPAKLTAGDEPGECDCSPYDDDPCGPTSNCINRELYTECDANKCPAGDQCNNQCISKKIFPSCTVRYMGDKGFGLIADTFICQDTLVTEYVGELITEEEYQKRRKSKLTSNTYFMQYGKRLYIDAEKKGNTSRFMNHSCKPNCETRYINVKGVQRIGLFAEEDIQAGTELTFNYEFDGEEYKCCCGESICRGIIGGKTGGKIGRETGGKVERKTEGKVVKKIRQSHFSLN